MAIPLTRVYVAFDGVTPTEITSQVASINIRRGRSRLNSKFEAGTMDVTLFDQTGNWDPTNTSSPYYPDLTPMRPIWVVSTSGTTGGRIFTGYITNYDTRFSTGVNDVSSVVLRCTDAFKLLAQSTITTVAGATAGQLTGARIIKILEAINLDTALYLFNIDTGDTTLQADPGTQRTVLDALQVVENSEFGGIFITIEGKIRFLSRTNLIKKLTTGYLYSDDGSTNNLYTQAQVVYDDTTLANQVSVTRSGGTTQTVSDATSIANYFIHAGVRDGILVQTDAESLNQAKAILATRKDPEIRIDSITINLDNNSLDALVLPLQGDILDGVSIVKTMPGGGTINKTLLVTGIHHDITKDKHTTTLYTTEPLIKGFILDSAVSGILDQDVLSY